MRPTQLEGVEALASHILSGKISIVELMRSPAPGDYRAHVEMIRLTLVLFSVPGVQQALLKELKALRPANLPAPDVEAIDREVTRKDGQRRFNKLIEHRNENRGDGRAFLTGESFEVCQAQYVALLAHVEWLWDSACKAYLDGNAPVSTFLAILTVEEVGKLSHVWEELVRYDAPVSTEPGNAVDRSHRRKHFMAAASGAIINARLDRVLGKETIRRLLHEAESDELEKTRQACLYVDVKDAVLRTPQQMISADRARTLVVFAGELMAEVLGYFPWDFERMIQRVMEFELLIGMPKEKVSRL